MKTLFVCLVETIKALTHQERFHSASLVKGKTSKTSMADGVVSPCFAFNLNVLTCLGLKDLDTPYDGASFLSDNSKTSKKSMSDPAVPPRLAMLFFEV